jgi:hypothetical protein
MLCNIILDLIVRQVVSRGDKVAALIYQKIQLTRRGMALGSLFCCLSL